MSKRLSKERYDSLPDVLCKCGCGQTLKSKDAWGRPHYYIQGHNTPRKYDDPKQYIKEYLIRNKEKRYKKKTEYLHNIKIELLRLLGNECVRCGLKYDGTNAVVFDIHHIDPSTKTMNLSMSAIARYSQAVIRKEAIEKCTLLCSNCHRLHHNGGW